MGDINIKYQNRNSEMVMGVDLGIVRVMSELLCSVIFWQTSHIEMQRDGSTNLVAFVAAPERSSKGLAFRKIKW